MSAHNYYNGNSNNQNASYPNYEQPQHGQSHDGYSSSSYGQNQSQHPSDHNQNNEALNWGYGGGSNQQPASHQTQGYHDSYSATTHTTQHYSSYDHNQGYNQQQDYNQTYQNYSQSHDPYQHPATHEASNYSGATAYDRELAHHQQGGHQPDTHGYPAQGTTHQQAPYPGGPSTTDGDRGLLGALGGAAVGGYAGHKMNHGIIGTLGGAYAGHKLEDKLKDKKKKDKKDKYSHGAGGRRNSSSSSSSSSSDDDKKKKNKHKYGAMAAAVVYGHGKQGQQQVMAGNFSGSCTQISLDRDYDLIASCGMVGGGQRLSSIDLNDCLENSWGQFRWVRGGGFGASSRNVRLVDGGRVLEAELGDGRGGWNVARVRLDERITNNDGDLQFMG